MNPKNETNAQQGAENVVQHEETGNHPINKPFMDINSNSPANLTTLIPKYCVWGIVVSGGASMLYPFTIFELPGASDFVNNYAQYFGAFTEQQMLEYARNFGNINTANVAQPDVASAPRAQEQPLPRVNPAPAAGVAPDNDDPNNHDWLDTLGTVARVLVLLSFIYVNGSFPRLLLLVGLYFLTKYYLRQQNEINNANPNQRQNEQEPHQQVEQPQQRPANEPNPNLDNPNLLQQTINADSNVDQTNSPSSPLDNPTNDARRSLPTSSLYINLVKALFTSLIPNPGQAINDGP